MWGPQDGGCCAAILILLRFGDPETAAVTPPSVIDPINLWLLLGQVAAMGSGFRPPKSKAHRGACAWTSPCVFPDPVYKCSIHIVARTMIQNHGTERPNDGWTEPTGANLGGASAQPIRLQRLGLAIRLSGGLGWPCTGAGGDVLQQGFHCRPDKRAQRGIRVSVGLSGFPDFGNSAGTPTLGESRLFGVGGWVGALLSCCFNGVLQKGAYWHCTCLVLFDDPTGEDSAPILRPPPSIVSTGH